MFGRWGIFLGGVLVPLSAVSSTFSTLHWTADLCPEACRHTLEQQLLSLRGVDRVQLAANSATVHWQQPVHFSVRGLKRALQAVGLGFNRLEVEVTGQIQKRQGHLWLVVPGGGPSFILALPPSDAVAATKPHPTLLPLNEPTDPLLKEALVDSTPVRVEGRLYRPLRSSPFILLIERLSSEEQSEDPGQRL